jgi:hypothetical protein
MSAERASEERLREGLRAIPVPDEEGARERGWRLAAAAASAADAVPPTPWRRRGGRRVSQVAIVLGLLAAAVISPAGAAVRDWVGEAVEGGHEPSLPALTSLPAPGPLLVDSAHGAWVVQDDGSKRLLGSYRQATWSPHGLFVAAVSEDELVALDPEGEVHWALPRPGAPSDPAWSPDGYRIAYLSGGTVRTVAGDGTGDHESWARAEPVTPAWRPGPGHLLTLAEPGGRLRTVDADSGRSIAVTPIGLSPTGLEWSRDGSRLLVFGRTGLEVLDGSGHVLWRRSAPSGTDLVAAALALGGGRVAAVVGSRRGRARSELLLIGARGTPIPVFSGPGRFSGVSVSAAGRWALLEWPTADQWLFLDLAHPQRVVAVSDISAQFAPGSTSPSAFPSVAGWCCEGPPTGP